jgi:hypothetical protein
MKRGGREGLQEEDAAGGGGKRAAIRQGGSRWKILLRLAVSAFLLWLVLRRADMGEILRALAAVNAGWLAAAYLLHLVGYLLSAWRWHVLLDARGRRVGAFRLSLMILVGSFFNFFLPTTIGGDVVRAGEEAESSGVSLAESLGVVTTDRLSGVVALLMLALGGAMIGLESSQESTIFWGSVVLGVVALGVLALLASGSLLPRLERLLPPPLARPVARVEKMLSVLRALASTPAVAARAVAISLLFHCNVIVHYVFIARALGIETPAAHFFIIVPVVLFILQIPFSINGIGYREGGFSLMLGGVGVGTGQAVALAWLDLAMILSLGVVGGVLFLLRGGRLPTPLTAFLSGSGRAEPAPRRAG